MEVLLGHTLWERTEGLGFWMGLRLKVDGG